MKKATVFVVVLLLLLSISACDSSQLAEKAENVYLTDVLDGDILVSDVKVLDIYAEDEAAAYTPVQQKELVLGGKTYTLQYNRLWQGKHEYVTAETTAYLTPMIKARFHPETEEVLAVVADASVYSIPKNAEESLYVEWIKQFVAQYYEEDWDEYTYSCETRVIESYENGAGSVVYDGFRIINDDEDYVASYRFTFTKYIDGFASSDQIYVSVSPDMGKTTVFFCPHEFDQIDSVAVDLEKIHSSIDAFLQLYINSESYKLSEYEVENPKVTFIDGKLYYQVTLDVTAKHKATGELRGFELIPIAVQVTD